MAVFEYTEVALTKAGDGLPVLVERHNVDNNQFRFRDQPLTLHGSINGSTQHNRDDKKNQASGLSRPIWSVHDLSKIRPHMVFASAEQVKNAPTLERLSHCVRSPEVLAAELHDLEHHPLSTYSNAGKIPEA